MILMSRMQDVAEIRLYGRTDESGPIHDLRNVLKSFRDLNPIDRAVDARKRADDFLDVQAFLIWLVAFWIESFRSRHASGHPQNDA